MAINLHMKYPALFLTLLLVSCTTPEAEVQPSPEPKPLVRVKVFASDASRQCAGEGVSPQAAARQLQAQGIDVFCAQKASTGFMYPSVCGADTGRINVLTIDEKNLTRVKALGFEPVSSLSSYQDKPCLNAGS